MHRRVRGGTRGYADVRHLRPHRGHPGHAHAAAAEGPTRSRADGRPGRFQRVLPGGAPRLRPLHGADPGAVHRRRLADHRHDPDGSDGEAPAAPPSGAPDRGHVRGRQPHQRPARVRRRPRRCTRSSTSGSAATGRLAAERFEDVLGIIRRALRTGEISSRGIEVLRLPHDADGDAAGPGAHPVLVPRQSGHRRSVRTQPDVAGAGRRRVVRRSTSTRWNAHMDDEVRLEAPGAEPRVGLHDAASRSPRTRPRRSTSPSEA